MVKQRYVTLTFDTETYQTIGSEIELGDCLFAKFDERATHFTYKSFKLWAVNESEAAKKQWTSYKKYKPRSILQYIGFKSAEEIDKISLPPFIVDLHPAYTFLTHERVKEVSEDFDKILEKLQVTLLWIEDEEVQIVNQ